MRMMGRYLIRLDDACPTQDRSRWLQMEALLDSHGLRPIVAIIPDNQDVKLMPSPPDDGFWQRARSWQRRGWAIAQHGYRHLYETTSAGIVPINRRSEFAGLPFEVQSHRIAEGYRLLRAQGLDPQLWVAPAHSFDHQTLRALQATTPIRTISDGIALAAFQYAGFRWLPQQLWAFKRRPFGLWTICLHPNTMSEQAIEALGKSIEQHRDSFIDVSEALRGVRPRRLVDRVAEHAFFALERARRSILRRPVVALKMRVASGLGIIKRSAG
jgi:predicted deacetylase